VTAAPQARIDCVAISLAANGETAGVPLDKVVAQIPFREIDVEKKVKFERRAGLCESLHFSVSRRRIAPRDPRH